MEEDINQDGDLSVDDSFETIGNLSVVVLLQLRKKATEVGGVTTSVARHASLASAGRSNAHGGARGNEKWGAAETVSKSAMSGAAQQRFAEDGPDEERTLRVLRIMMKR